jgi:hypothetical protein
MTHPALGQNLFEPSTTHEYHLQVFSPQHKDWLSTAVYHNEAEAHADAETTREGAKKAKGARAPKYRVIKIARHTVYGEPQEIQTPIEKLKSTLSASDVRKIQKMMSDQAPGAPSGRRSPKPTTTPKPKKQIIDLTDVATSASKKKGK